MRSNDDFMFVCKTDTSLGDLCRDVYHLDYLSQKDRQKIVDYYNKPEGSPNEKYHFLISVFNTQTAENPGQEARRILNNL